MDGWESILWDGHLRLSDLLSDLLSAGAEREMRDRWRVLGCGFGGGNRW